MRIFTSLLISAALPLGGAAFAHPGGATSGSSDLNGTYASPEAFEWSSRNTDFAPAFDDQFRAPIQNSDVTFSVEVLAQDMTHPWGIAVLPDGAGYLVTEQSGHLHHVGVDGAVSEPIEGAPEVLYAQQGGMLDVATGPNFAEDRMIYMTYSKQVGTGDTGAPLVATAAARGVLSEDLSRLENVEDIFVQEPPSPSPMHYGSRIVFDGAGHAFITTGEHFTQKERDYAQDLDKTYGKVIRVNLDGSVPQDNPFVGQEGAVDTIWSLGHRNVQGAAFDADGTLWVIEHGPKGGDELNRPEPGANYGWPVVSYGRQYNGPLIGSGEASGEGFTQPVYFWDPVIAPGGMDFHHGEMFSDWNGDILTTSYTGLGVVRLEIGEEGQVTGEERFLSELGGVQDVEVLEDGSFLLLTNAESGELLHVTRAEGS
jgi:glucose/arabinose dehydrogenase